MNDESDPGAGADAGPYSAPQLRMDTWNDLQQRSAWLAEFAKEKRDLTEPRRLVDESLAALREFESYWAYPGAGRLARLERLLARGEFADMASETRVLTRRLVGDAYRHVDHQNEAPDAGEITGRDGVGPASRESRKDSKLYFEVLVVDGAEDDGTDDLRDGLRRCRRETDEFVYEIVTVPSLEDAVIAVQFNWTIQSVVLRNNHSFSTTHEHPAFERYLGAIKREGLPMCFGLERNIELCKLLKKIRPELDVYLVTDAPLDQVAGKLGTTFRRVFYRLEQYMEQHLSILKGIRQRYETPFFDALRRFSAKPTGVFHALPIARGKSMRSGHWTHDLLEFYGENIFMAETSATSGGLDSLLQPRGPIKKAQDLAARAFGARQSYFVTNGTSTGNKIVAQALIQPGEIVLVDRDCHKSHHYALVLAGALPVYLDSYPLQQYSMYGAVPLEEIEQQLHHLRDAGKLDRVKMLILTNCTFDGITYDPQRVMERVLAIKPDMVFLWDEAWFAYGRFSPLFRKRTAMDAAAEMRTKFRSTEYRQAYDTWESNCGDGPPMVDPDRARVRVYATHSTHKTLTSLRQGSMIHVFDEDFEQKASDSFRESFMTHTSTSPNYQIVASLDAGRRQIELEGFEMVEQTISLAMLLRQQISEHPLLRRFFSVLRSEDMIPEAHRESGTTFYYDTKVGWGPLDEAYMHDEFVLDPTRVTLYVGKTGIDGDTFRHLLMDRYDIQINKTSRNTLLFMPNIGTTRGDVAYLVDVLVEIAHELADTLSLESKAGLARHEEKVRSLTDGPPLPNFSRFHDAFKLDETGTAEGDIRRAYFLSYDNNNIDAVPLNRETLEEIRSGKEHVSAAFITPYPPGFPVLVPGQVVSAEIIEYLLELDVKEIHGYEPETGLRLFAPHVLSTTSLQISTPS